MKAAVGRHTPIGVDADGRFMKAAQLAGPTGSSRLVATASIPRADPGGPLSEDDVRRLAAVLGRQGFRGREVTLSVPRDRVITSFVQYDPERSDAELTDAVRAELAAVHRCEPRDLEVASWSLPRPTRGRGSSWALGVGCVRNEVQALIDLWATAGMDVVAVDIPSGAAMRVCAPLLDAESPIALLDVGWSAVNLVLSSSGVAIYKRALAEFGLIRLHAQLVHKCRLESELVDAVLQATAEDTSADGTPEAVATARAQVASFAGKLAAELKMSLAYASKEFAAGAVRILLLHGEGAALPPLGAFLSTELSMEARTVTPTEVVRVEGSAVYADDPALLTAVGLALHPGG